MAKISDIKSIIANMTVQTNSGPATITSAVQYPIKSATAVAKPEVHDIAPVQSPTYTVSNKQKEQPVPVATPTASDTNGNEQNKISVTGNQVAAAISHLIKDKDYGYVNGISDVILFKPGAIKIIRFFKLTVQETLLDKTVNVEQSFIGYTIKVSLIDESGCIVTEAIASANSMEKKFSKNGLGGDSMLPAIAAKRALICAAKFLINR